MTPKIHVVINPASSQMQPVWKTRNRVFHPAGIERESSITNGSYETLGYTCLIDTSNNGFAGMGSKLFQVDDGLLDVIPVCNARICSLVADDGSLNSVEPRPEYVGHWQVREGFIETDPS